MQALSISEGDGRLPKSSTSTTDGTAEVSLPGPLASATDVEADVVKDERSFGDLRDGLGLISLRVYRFQDGQAPLLSRHIFGNFFMSPSVKCFSQRQVQLVTLKSSLSSTLFMRLHQRFFS